MTNVWKSNLHILSHNTICKWKIDNWKFNRPVAKDRIENIISYIRKTGKVEGIIYLAKHPDKDVYAVYDGVHRLTALQEIFRSQFSDMLGMTSFEVLVDIMEYSDDAIKERFVAINSSVPVAELYTDVHKDLEHIKLVQRIVHYYQMNYPSFFTDKLNYRVPNIHPNIFTQHIDKLVSCDMVTHKIRSMVSRYTLEMDDYMYVIELFHQRLRERPKQSKINRYTDRSVIRIQSTQHEKCIKNNMFLFCVSDWLNQFESFLQNV